MAAWLNHICIPVESDHHHHRCCCIKYFLDLLYQAKIKSDHFLLDAPSKAVLISISSSVFSCETVSAVSLIVRDVSRFNGSITEPIQQWMAHSTRAIAQGDHYQLLGMSLLWFVSEERQSPNVLEMQLYGRRMKWKEEAIPIIRRKY